MLTKLQVYEGKEAVRLLYPTVMAWCVHAAAAAAEQ